MKLPNDSVERIVSSFATVELGDPRRAERLETMLRRLAESPRATTPDAMVTEAELEGAYRFLRSKHVTLDALTLAHSQATAMRAKRVGRVLAIHDSTTCEFAHASASEVGYLSTGKPGFVAHYTLIVANDGSRRPLGVTNAEAMFRQRPPARPSKTGRKLRSKNGAAWAKDPNRESLRWSRGFRQANERLQECSAVIHVADREGDSYELLGTAIQHRLRFVIRCRVPERRATSEDGDVSTVRALAQASSGRFTREVELSKRRARSEPYARQLHPPRAGRTATLSFSATAIEICRPRYLESLPETLSLNMVRVWEQGTPDEKPIEWLLFTTEPVSTQLEVEAVVDMYRARWLIEECNKAIKTGCRYEERQFEGRHALLNLLALTFPIACELLWLRSCCRAEPSMSARDVLTETQIKILKALGRSKLPAKPTAHDVLWAVAALGGHIRSNGEPGWLVLHRGLAKLLAYEEGWLAREKAAGLSISR